MSDQEAAPLQIDMQRVGDLGEVPRELMPHWVIAGGESGRAARKTHPEWFRNLRDQCAAAGVPFLFKQWGEWTPGEVDDPADGSRYWVDEFGTGVEIQGPQLIDWMGEVAFCRIGKKAAGRLLDQRTHDGFPEAPVLPGAAK